MALSVQDTNELGTPFPTDWMVMTTIRISIQRSTINNTVRGLVTCRWNEHEVKLIPDPSAAPEANISEDNLVRLAVGSEIQVRGLINVRAHFQGQGSRRHRIPVLTMTLDVTQSDSTVMGAMVAGPKADSKVMNARHGAHPLLQTVAADLAANGHMSRPRPSPKEEERDRLTQSPTSMVCSIALDLDAELCMDTNYIEGYSRLLNMDGSAQEQVHTLFTFRQNRASGIAH
ncbi:hypothetical protein BGZ93_008353 [Podila epicladia]|nr:hypothetical protein BGZ92_011515 [Podila epicladia]KAG0092389.1 hypothetical protein BGZ93_008353 [Podila epicladia]